MAHAASSCVGNSLLLHGIDRDSLRVLMGPNYQVVLYPIEGTTYLDWAYGLRRLFAEGSRPAVVVLCISTRHLLSDATDGEGFAHALMQLRDLRAGRARFSPEHDDGQCLFFRKYERVARHPHYLSRRAAAEMAAGGRSVGGAPLGA